MINREKSRILDLDGTARHDQLFYYSKIKNEHLKLSQGLKSPEETFQPKINSSFDCEKTRQTFFERQQADCKQREFRQQMLEQMNSPSNLRPSMVPMVGRGPLGGSTIKQDKGQELYESAFKTKRNIEAMRREQADEITKKANEPKVLATSNNFMEDLTSKRLEEIFVILDSNEDGLISPEKIDVEALDGKVLQILHPVLLYMENHPGVSYDLPAFTRIVKERLKVS